MAISTGSPLGELIKSILPGANEDALAQTVRNGAKMVVLTQAQYDSLVTKDATTIYLVTS